jgi:hypothetical protein
MASRPSRRRSSKPAAPKPGAQNAKRPVAQPKRAIGVGPSDDAYEREANATADRVLSGQDATTISRIPPAGLPKVAQREEAAADEAEDKTEEPEEATAAQAWPLQREAAESDEEETTPEGEEGAEAAQTLQRAEDDEKTGASEEIPDEAEAVQQWAQRESREEKGEGEESVQTKPAREAGRPDALSVAAERAVADKDAGEPLDPGVRRSLESRMRTDLHDVRVHRNQRAEDAASALRARAFTHGRDVWLGRGESPRDTRLLAHEATHVVQQTHRPQHPVVQRAGTTTAGPGAPAAAGAGASPTILDTPAGTIDVQNKTMRIPTIRLPEKGNKKTVAGPFKASKPGRVDNTQRDKWLASISGAGVSTKVDTLLPDSKAIPSPSGEKIFYTKLKSQKSYCVGDRETLKQQMRLPNWGPDGKNLPLEVDHVKELQLGGDVGISNLQLLDRWTNGASGNAIRNEISTKIKEAVAPHVGEGKHWPKAPAPDSLRADFKEIAFERVDSETISVEGPNIFWTLEQVQNQGAHLEALHVLTAQEVEAAKDPPLVGNETQLLLYMSPSAGQPKPIAWKDGAPKGGLGAIKIRGFQPTGITYSPGAGGQLTGVPFKKNKVVEGSIDPIPIEEVGGLPYTGRLMTGSVKNQLRLRVKGASPVELDDATFGDEAFGVTGRVILTPSILKGTTIDFALDGDDITLSKTFTADEFSFPGPIQITQASLTLSAGTAGLKAEGSVDFEVQRVGKGTVTGIGDVSKGFGVEGQFEFDKKLFNDADAKIKLRYAENVFSGEGTLKIGAGKVKGVKSATLKVAVQGGVWTADGTVIPDVPGVKQGTLSVKFDPDAGLDATGRLEFGEGIPRLKSGFLQARIVQTDDAYSVEGKGAATLDIPGGGGGITAEYKAGLFKAEGTLAYGKGIASGSITAGVTNKPVGEEGQPAGSPGETLSVYGQGSVTIKFTPWLQGTAGIKIAPSGKMEITGRVALPDTVEVFPQKQIDKKLLSVGVDIPIVGVAVAGQRIGIFLNISANLTARASIGPGQLKNVAVEVTFDPEDEASAKVKGTARFVVPAEAGLRLGISGALGAGIPIVSAKAGLEIGGQLGVKGEASASAVVEWSPSTGIDMEADVSLLAQPVFTFDITGFVDVTADLVLTTVELYKKKWQLAKFEYGADMQVGAKMPVRIKGGVLQDLSVSDIEFITPDVNPLDLAKGLIKKIA